MPDRNQAEGDNVLTPLDPGRTEKLAERLNWRYDGTTLQKRISFSTREEAFEFLAWLIKRVSRVALDLSAAQRGGEIEIILTSSGQGFTTNDLRLARHVNAKTSPASA